MGAALHLGLIVWLLIWRPSADKPMTFFVISGLWGVGDAVWQTQVNGTLAIFLLQIKNKISKIDMELTECP